MLKPEVERELIRRCQRGEARFYEPLVRAYEPAGFGFAVAMLGEVRDARDALTEAFSRTFRSLHAVDSRRPFELWFFRVLRIRCREVLLGRRKSSPAESSAGDPEGMAAGDPRPWHPGERSVVQASLRWALGRIGEDHREVLVLKELHGFRYGEIAEILAIPEEGVVGRLLHARRSLREALEATGAATWVVQPVARHEEAATGGTVRRGGDVHPETRMPI
jgi:RNA polymerase sigma-70 factor, ECF subfamily